MIKICRESLKPVLQALEQNDLINFSFDWAATFNDSIFQEAIQNEIIPIILVLKKFARTNIGNCSLRSVLARKLVNIKVKYGIMDPEEMPKQMDHDENETNQEEGHVASGDINDRYLENDEVVTMPYEITRGF